MAEVGEREMQSCGTRASKLANFTAIVGVDEEATGDTARVCTSVTVLQRPTNQTDRLNFRSFCVLLRAILLPQGMQQIKGMMQVGVIRYDASRRPLSIDNNYSSIFGQNLILHSTRN